MATNKPRKVSICRKRFPKVDMSKHKTGDALIAHIRQFNKDRNLAPGGLYIIGGKEVRI